MDLDVDSRDGLGSREGLTWWKKRAGCACPVETVWRRAIFAVADWRSHTPDLWQEWGAALTGYQSGQSLSWTLSELLVEARIGLLWSESPGADNAE